MLFVVHCWEECLLGRHLCSHFQFAIRVLQVSVSGALPAQHVPAISLIDVDHSDHRGERISVRSSAPPLEAYLLVLLNRIVVELVIWILKQDLVSASQLQLLDLKRHFTYATSAILEPHRVGCQIAIQIILLTV